MEMKTFATVLAAAFLFTGLSPSHGVIVQVE